MNDFEGSADRRAPKTDTHSPHTDMNNKLLLVTGITLLYRESQLPGGSENSASLIRQIADTIKLSDLNIGLDHDRDVVEGLRTTALVMCDDPLGHKYEQAEIMQRLKMNCMDDEALYDTLYDGMVPELSENGLKRTCLNLKRTLANHFKEGKIAELINEASFRLKFQRSKIADIKKFVNEIVSNLEPYQVDTAEKDPAIISDVDLSDEHAVTGVFAAIKDMAEGTTIMRTGFQGMNRLLDGGFRRGEQWVIGALQHKFKTGFSLTLFEHIALYNVPVMIDPKKKPLLLRISFEDPLTLNFQYLYQNLKESETGVVPDLTGVSDEEMARYVKQRLSVNGYHVRFMHVNPSMWTYRDITNKILELESEGFEVHLLMLDYLLKVPTTGCTQGAMGVDLLNMYERVGNFCKQRGICNITPHQLSTDAKMRVREGQLNFVQGLVGGGFYAGCKQIDQVVDGELFIHIEKVNNTSWLTIQRGKHRKIQQTPEEFQYMVLPFCASGLMGDLGKADSTRKKVGGGPIGSGQETPYWEVDDAPR